MDSEYGERSKPVIKAGYDPPPKKKILIIEAPVRHGKSHLCSQYLPAWYLCRYPDNNVIFAGHEATFARSWGRKCRDLVSQQGPSIANVHVSATSKAQSDWGIEGRTGGMICCGIGGSPVGRGANLLIVDDYLKSAEAAFSEVIRDKHYDWWQSVASTRLEPSSCAIIIATRWHQDDLIGRILLSGDERVERIRLPALAEKNDLLGRKEGEPLWPERWPLAELERVRDTKESYWWQALYQQNPGTHAKCEWPNEYFEGIYVDALPDSFDYSAISVDPSKGRDVGDFSSILFAGVSGGRIYVESSIERRPVYKIVQDTIDMYRRLKPMAVLVESNAFQEIMADVYDEACSKQGLPPLPLHLDNNTLPKEMRILRLGPYFARDRIRILRESVGNEILIRQCKEFPMGDHRDGPDSLEMAIRMLDHMVTIPEKTEEFVYA